MNNLSLLADQEYNKRIENMDFLFLTCPRPENPKELYGSALGKQIEEFENVIGKKNNMEVYKIFTDYISLKTMEVEKLEEENEHEKHVDKLYKEENNIIRILSVTNKLPQIDLYFAPDIEALRVDFAEFYNKYRYELIKI